MRSALREAHQYSASPAAKLLRGSRLFSLPPPLARPEQTLAGGSIVYGSDTATLPHPTHAAIVTPQSSLSRGDWGLKRSLPLKSTTKTTTPTIRIGDIDSEYHITDFDSAADHVLTLKKWQELNLPVTFPARKNSAYRAPSGQADSESVFERRSHATTRESAIMPKQVEQTSDSAVDETTVESQVQEAIWDKRRWKFDGPWLAGQQPGEFETYIEARIKPRRQEFNKFLKDWVMHRKVRHSKQQALDMGVDFDESKIIISEAEYRAVMRALRTEQTDLWIIIWEFLDLPGLPPDPRRDIHERLSDQGRVDTETSDLDRGPPQTHPSAGLSYLRTANILPNHPVLGPMTHQKPVQGRLLQHMNSSVGKNQAEPRLGIGGVVADSIHSRHMTNDDGSKMTFNSEIEGGQKVWLKPLTAHVDSRGRIKLVAKEADRDAVAVWEGKTYVPKEMPERKEAGGNWLTNLERLGASTLNYRKLV